MSSSASDRILCHCSKCRGRERSRRYALEHLKDDKQLLETLTRGNIAPQLAGELRECIARMEEVIYPQNKAYSQPSGASTTVSPAPLETQPFWGSPPLERQGSPMQFTASTQVQSGFGSDAQTAPHNPEMDKGGPSSMPDDYDEDNVSESESIRTADRISLEYDSDLDSSEPDSESGAEELDVENNENHGSALPSIDGQNLSGVLPQHNHPSEQVQIEEDDNSDDDPISHNPEFRNLSTPSLDALRKELLGDYQRPQNPPPPFSRPTLSSQQELSLHHFVAWQRSNGTVKAYKMHAEVLQKATGIKILSLHKAERLATSLTKLHPRKVDMCSKSCIAYTGKYANLEHCPYVSSSAKIPCNMPRYKAKATRNGKVPNAQYSVLSIMATIEALYANADTSRLMRSRDALLQKVLHLIATAGRDAAAKRVYSDFGDSHVHVDIHHNTGGIFLGERDAAFSLSTDGAQLTMKKHSNTWILILILLNLPPEIRYMARNIVISFATPGPNSPGDIESFLRPLFEELARASEGIWVWDAIDSSYFIFRGWVVHGCGDMLGSAKINGMAGHSGIYGDRFSEVQAAKASNTRGAKAQYYPMLREDAYNPGRPKYTFDDIPMRSHTKYFEILNKLEAARNENQRKNITKATGVVRLPLCAASLAFFHPTFFPLDPFHLIYENCMAFIWDLWTVETDPTELMHLPAAKAEILGALIPNAMSTLPPAFSGPIRDPHLKRQSQYKVFEWMALLHWYLIPIGIELGLNSIVLENFSQFVRSVEFAMTIKGRTEDDLYDLRDLIVKFLTGFEKLYIGTNPDRNTRARLCLFQLIHIPAHIQWNGSIRLGSQATVERAIGEMGHKIRSRKSPFANLINIIIRRELIRVLLLHYPLLSPTESATGITQDDSIRGGKPMKKLKIPEAEYQPGSPTFEHLVKLFAHIGIGDPNHEVDDVTRWGKLRLPNQRVLQSQASYVSRTPSRRSCWFLGIDQASKKQVFGEALAIYEAVVQETAALYVAFKKLEGTETIFGAVRGSAWSEEISVISALDIIDIVGIWDQKSKIYILQKHPGLAMLNPEERGVDDDEDPDDPDD